MGGEGGEKPKSTSKRKDRNNPKQVEVKRDVFPCDEHDDMIDKPTLPESPNRFNLSVLKIFLKNV